jgi:hypothetical protein
LSFEKTVRFEVLRGGKKGEEKQEEVEKKGPISEAFGY